MATLACTEVRDGGSRSGEAVLDDPQCRTCHGDEVSAAPPVDVHGQTATRRTGVGAHRTHLNPTIAAPVACGECHVVPSEVDAPGHLDEPPADITWGPLATGGGRLVPGWERGAAVCSSVYCHGSTLSGGTLTAPSWTLVDGTQAACGTCHGNPPPAPHPGSTACSLCHPATVRADGTLDIPGGRHLDGTVDVAAQACNSCHGNDSNAAPPRAVSGAEVATLVEIGAHQAHLAGGLVARPIACDECHVVPTDADAPGHADGPPAEVTWGPLATGNGQTAPSWERGSARCSSVYCHGATLSGGSVGALVWTLQDGTQTACGACHGAPPPAPHPASAACGLCHPGTVGPDAALDVAGGLHVNGVVDVAAQACNSCHGNEQNAAPPGSVAGAEVTTALEVGAHQAHLVGGSLALAIPCQACHVVPAAVDAEGHLDEAPAEVVWSGLAVAGGATPAWNRDNGTCSGVYCHGATLAGGSVEAPRWTVVDGSQVTCGACHGMPPPAPHPAETSCRVCHPATVAPDGTVDAAGGRHIDGQVQVAVSGPCGSCHGVPPDTGSHALHVGANAALAEYGDTSATADQQGLGLAYAFGCGNCHPIDAAHHGNGEQDGCGHAAEVDLRPSGAPSGSLKARNHVGATYVSGPTLQTDAHGLTYSMGTCSGTYCHSAAAWSTPPGITVPAPGPDFPFEGYPISYPSYQVDSFRAYANASWGGELSCDGCHGFPPRATAAKVQAGVGDSHSWIDERGFENLHGWAHGYEPVACATCHLGTVTDPGVRRRVGGPGQEGVSFYEAVPIVDHAAHVNGRADVTFSPEPVTFSATFDLAYASYDSEARTCSNVSCHFADTPVLWGAPYRWANGYECNVCHQY